MLEIPEAAVLARQLAGTLAGRRVTSVVADHTPHRLAAYTGDPGGYGAVLTGQVVSGAAGVGGMVELFLGPRGLLFSDGVVLRLHRPSLPAPDRHQLFVGLDDGSRLTASVQMDGGLLCVPTEDTPNRYYEAARAAPSPLTDAFGVPYFDALAARPEVQRLSLKAFLATEQRVPGFGNGVLQDVLWRAGLHPRRIVSSLEPADVRRLHGTVRSVLATMAAAGGRDTETDLFGDRGGYPTAMSRHHVGEGCPVCGTTIVKGAYLGGAIYFCPGCQPR